MTHPGYRQIEFSEGPNFSFVRLSGRKCRESVSRCRNFALRFLEFAETGNVANPPDFSSCPVGGASKTGRRHYGVRLSIGSAVLEAVARPWFLGMQVLEGQTVDFPYALEYKAN